MGFGRYMTVIILIMTISRSGHAGPLLPAWCKSWSPQPLSAANWNVAYTGYGQADFTSGIHLSPKPSKRADETHAGLVLLKTPPSSARYAVKLEYANVRPLREPASNPWETFWLFFDYKPDGANKRTNYIIHKPNGMELGRAWGSVDQDFIATSPKSKAKVGHTYEMMLIRDEKDIRVFIDGELSLKSNNVAALEKGGNLGLYTEDSHVWIKSFDLCQASP